MEYYLGQGLASIGICALGAAIACIVVFLMAVAVIAFVMTLLSLLLAHRKRINEVRQEMQKCYDNLKFEETWKKSRSPINEGDN